jgi:hypothetical protein
MLLLKRLLPLSFVASVAFEAVAIPLSFVASVAFSAVATAIVPPLSFVSVFCILESEFIFGRATYNNCIMCNML